MLGQGAEGAVEMNIEMFPKRRHSHCDPLCGRCQDWLDEVETIFRASVDEAAKAFWNVMEARHPGLISIPTGERYLVEGAFETLVEVATDGAFCALSMSATKHKQTARANRKRREHAAEDAASREVVR